MEFLEQLDGVSLWKGLRYRGFTIAMQLDDRSYQELDIFENISMFYSHCHDEKSLLNISMILDIIRICIFIFYELYLYEILSAISRF